MERRLLGKNFRFFENTTMHEHSTEEKEMWRQQRMKVRKDKTRKLDQKEGWMPRIDGELLICWEQTARPRAEEEGST